MEFIVATANMKKLAELKPIFAALDISLIPLKALGFDADIEETGSTFEENALIKARAAVRFGGRPALADDSGLCVDYLGGAPGVYSARYGGEAAKSDTERWELLLRKMAAAEDRRAAFVCCMACVFPDGRELTVRGECPGVILREAKGTGGFGYDPVFHLPEFGMTFAELPQAVKNRVSHRARAAEAMREALKPYLET